MTPVAARAARATRAKKVTHETGISGNFDDTEYREKSAGYDGPEPTPGLYKAKLTSVGQHTTTEDSIVWTFDITEGKYAGWRGWVYTNMSTAKFKTQDILVALGIMEPEGEINATFEEIMKKAQPLRIRVISEPYEDEKRAKVRSFLKIDPNAATSDEDNDGDAPEQDPDFDDGPQEKAPATRRGRRAAAPEPEAEPDTADALDIDALEEELEGLSSAELKKKAREFGLTRQEMKDLEDDDELIDAILEKAEEQNPPF